MGSGYSASSSSTSSERRPKATLLRSNNEMRMPAVLACRPAVIKGVCGVERLSSPLVLFVHSPNGQEACQGQYTLVDGWRPNGEPLWQQSDGRHWIYSGRNRKWCICGKDVQEEQGFNCSAGWIYQTAQHGGLTPDEADVSWAWFDASIGKFREDPSIVVTAQGPKAGSFNSSRSDSEAR